MPKSVSPPQSSRSISGEFALIDSIRSRAARRSSGGLHLGIGDDCALLRPAPGHEICVTTDFSLENAHFRRDWHPPQSAGHRCLARGLSDLAAMGADPLAVFLSLALPARTPAAWVDEFLDGLFALANKYRVPLAGGDTAQSPSGLISADIVAVGQVPGDAALLRSGARAGDILYVTGALGGAAAELESLARAPHESRSITQAVSGHPHLYPEPRLAVGRRLRALAHSAVDVSDGLSTDLAHLCDESHLSAVIDETALPIHPLAFASDARGGTPSALALALHGGEDYELLFTAPASARVPRFIAGVPTHRIGTMQKPSRRGTRIVLNQPGRHSRAIEPAGWEHFR